MIEYPSQTPSIEQVRALLRELQIHGPRLLYGAVQCVRNAMTSDLDPFQVQDHTEGFVAALRIELADALLRWEKATQAEAGKGGEELIKQQTRFFALLREVENLCRHIASSHGEEALYRLGVQKALPGTLHGLQGFLEDVLRRVRLPDFSLPSPPYDYLPGWSARGLESLFLRYQKQLASISVSLRMLREADSPASRPFARQGESTAYSGVLHTTDAISTFSNSFSATETNAPPSVEETQEPVVIVTQLYWAAKHLYESLVFLSQRPTLPAPSLRPQNTPRMPTATFQKQQTAAANTETLRTGESLTDATESSEQKADASNPSKASVDSEPSPCAAVQQEAVVAKRMVCSSSQSEQMILLGKKVLEESTGGSQCLGGDVFGRDTAIMVIG